MRKTTGTEYPHHNLDQLQREAISRLGSPLVRFRRDWTQVYLTDPLPEDRKGLTFYPRRRRTWTVYLKGYPAVRVYGKIVKRT